MTNDISDALGESTRERHRPRERPAQLEHARRWMVVTRIPRTDIAKLGTWQLAGLPGYLLIGHPPVAPGLEGQVRQVEIRFQVVATRHEIAERLGERLWRRLGYRVLALRVMPA